MNRTDAAATLSIAPSASPEEAKRAYQELFTEHQVRLTNAPTPALRSLYQARLLELDAARDAFLAPTISDADSDLPTDQPSIPTYGAGSPPGQAWTKPPGDKSREELPPPVQSSPRRDAQPSPVEPAQRREQQPPPPAPREKSADTPVEARKRSGLPKALGIVIGLGVVLLAVWQLTRSRGPSSGVTPADSTAAGAPTAWAADSLPRIRESITVARVEFGRGDYDAADGALKDADSLYARVPAGAKTDTAVVQVKSQLDSLHGKVQRACEALRKVAERHPGEPTCKSH